MKKINSFLGLGYTAIPNTTSEINTDSGGGFTRAKGMGPKSLFLFFLMALFFWAIPTNTWGDTTTIDGVIYTLNDADSTASVTGRTDALPTSVSIRGTVTYNDKNYTVTSIENEAFYRCDKLVTIEIPVSVIRIGAYAFAYNDYESWSNLKTVIFAEGSNLQSIGDHAFYQCIKLASIEIPASVISIGAYAFADNWANKQSILQSVIFAEGSNLQSIGDYAFSECAKLNSLELPSSVTWIGQNAFLGCNLRDVFFLGNKPETGNSTIFSGNEKMTYIYFVEGEKGWEDGATWQDQITKVAPNAFHEEDGIRYALYDFNNTAFIAGFTSELSDYITIPNSVSYNKKTYTITNIGRRAFRSCSVVKRVTFAEGSQLETIENGGFSSCSSLTAIEKIPASVTAIGESTFANDKNLRKVTFADGNRLESIGNKAFYCCENLSAIKLPDYVTDIGEYVFYDSGLVTIDIPASVTRIRNGAFQECESLENVTFAEGSKLQRIGDAAFRMCYKLTSIVIPENVIEVGDWAFAGHAKHAMTMQKIIFLGDQPLFTQGGTEMFYNNPLLPCVYFIEDKEDWVDGGTWCGKTTKAIAPKPSIITQPTSQTIVEGNSVIFSVTATSKDLHYQWYKDGIIIENAIEASYAIESVKNSDAGTYTVTVSNIAGSVTSNEAILTVTIPVPKPVIATQPVSQTINEGKSVTFSVIATGNGLKYQWKKAGASISGATSASYTISSVKTSDAGDYTVTVSNDGGSVTSSVATLTVIAKPVIKTQPVSQTVTEESSVTFSVVATGSNLKYQWNKDGKAINGATSASYTIASAQKSDSGSYSVTVSNAAGSVTSSAATLTVTEAPGGTAIRSITVDGLTATVTLALNPNSAVKSCFVEEKVPSIGTITPKDGGVYTASKGVIRWSFLGNATECTLTYTVTVPSNYDDIATVSGEVTFDTTVKNITGDTELDFTVKTHPADMNDDFEISTVEIANYAMAWTQGRNWNREPVEIPMAYASKAAMIWVYGGSYIYDASRSKPACWVYGTMSAASLKAAAASTAKRTVKTSDGKGEVSIEIAPAAETNIHFVEEKLSAKGTLNVSNISDGGNYIADKNLIRWSFLDNAPRNLTYTVEPGDGFSGSIALSGEVMFDEETLAIEGDSEISFGSEITYELEDGAMLLTFTGTLESSEDGIHWTALDAVSPYRVTITDGKKFFRSVK